MTARKSIVARAHSFLTPSRRSAWSIFVGTLTVVYGIALWLPVLAIVLAGVALLVYGFVLVDLDGEAPVRRRRR